MARNTPLPTDPDDEYGADEEIPREEKNELEAGTPNAPVDFQLGGSDRMTDWKNEPSLQALKNDWEAARPSHDTLVSKIKRWENLLRVQGEAKPKEVKGRSRVQPKLIRKQAEWRYPALSEPFLSSSNMFKVDPVTFEDEPAARQNALVLNHQFRNKINRVNFIDNLVRATVDEGTAVVRLGWCQYTRVKKVQVPVYDHYPLDPSNPDHQQPLMALQQALQLQTDDPHGFSSLDPALRAAVEFFSENGQPTYAVQVSTQEQEQEEVYDNRPTLEVKNLANIYVDPSCNGDLDKALFIVESFETHRAELAKEPDRYTNLDKVNWEGNTTITDPNHETNTPNTFNFNDKARKKVVAYEYWGYYDVEGNGNLQAIVVTWIGDVIIRMESNPFPDQKLPYVVIPYSPIKRELFGEPDAELLGDNQAILGAVTRGMIDSMARSANGQRGYAKGMLDAANRRKFEAGEDYEFNPNMPTNQGMMEHKYPDIPQSAMLMLNLQTQEAESLTGVKSFSGGMSGNAYGDVAAGIKGMLDAAAKREMAILRRVAKGVSDIGKKILMMNGVFLGETEVVRITNEQFVTVSRDDLKGQFDCIVDISTYEVDNAKAQDLGFMLQTIGPNMDPGIAMEILAQIADLKRMPDLAHRLRTWQPKPDPVQQQLQQLQVQKAQMEVQVLQSQVYLNQAQAQSALAQAGLKNLEKVERETGTEHQRELDKQQAQARGNQHLAVTKALLEPTKEGETQPDVKSAIGYNAVSEQMERESARSQ